MTLRLRALPGRYAVARLPCDAAVPEWARGAVVSITRSDRELSIVCADDAVPADVTAERDFVGWRVDGTLDFALTGILARLTQPLADAQVSLFALSTFETDYVWVRAPDAAAALAAWRSAAVFVDELQ